MIPTMGGAVLAVAVILSPGANTDAALAPATHEVAAKPLPRTSHGIASYVRASLGSHYLASRLPKGTRLRVCGPAGCISGTVNDYGPSKRLHPERIVDLSAYWFTNVCGPLSMGLCKVTVTR